MPSTRSQAREKLWMALGEAAPVLVPVSQVMMCMNCTSDFSLTLRRHHCNACGKVSQRFKEWLKIGFVAVGSLTSAANMIHNLVWCIPSNQPHVHWFPLENHFISLISLLQSAPLARWCAVLALGIDTHSSTSKTGWPRCATTAMLSSRKEVHFSSCTILVV